MPHITVNLFFRHSHRFSLNHEATEDLSRSKLALDALGQISLSLSLSAWERRSHNCGSISREMMKTVVTKLGGLWGELGVYTW